MNLLSRRGLLAIATVVDVASQVESPRASAKAISSRHKLPPRHLETLLVRIPTKPAMHSNRKPGRDSDLKPATQRSLPRIGAMMLRRDGSVKRAPILGLRRPRRMVGS